MSNKNRTCAHTADNDIIARGHRNRWPREIYNIIYVKLRRDAREDFWFRPIRRSWILRRVSPS